MESILKQYSFEYQLIDFKEQYRDFLKTKYDITEFIEKCDSFSIVESFESEQIDGFSTTLVEHNVEHDSFTPKDKIIFYVHSDEFCPHHIPHVHVKVRGKCYNYCSISLVDCTLLARNKVSNDKTINECIKKLKQIVSEARKTWNESSKSLLSFKINGDGELTSEFEKRD